jgi:hypothetical protein
MAEACPGTTARKLDWLASLHIRDETYALAIAELVNHHHRHAFAEHWGEGKTSSSDGLRFRASGRGEAAGHGGDGQAKNQGEQIYAQLFALMWVQPGCNRSQIMWFHSHVMWF